MRISEGRDTPFLTVLRAFKGRTVPHGKAYRQLPPHSAGCERVLADLANSFDERADSCGIDRVGDATVEFE